VSKTKREKKISKVMGEFKEGTLKSGGSGRKVTNPKQAIAIALSEANAMNQGGMMYNEIMNRPMFQTPQMREGGGIMAGIAPIRGYAEGDLVVGGRSKAAQDDDEDEIVATGTEEELVDQLFGPGGLLFDTDAPVQSTLMALTVPLGAGLLGFTARGLMAARRMSQAAKAAKTADKADDAQMVLPGIPAAPAAATGAAATGTAAGAGIMGGRMASAIRRNPKKSAAAGITALGLGTPALIGEDEEGKQITEPGPEETGGDDGGGTKERTFLDMFRDTGERLREFYSDPATQYGLAVAAQPTEGFVPRNALSDFIIGREQYKTLEADREDDTALMRNYEFLRENTDLSPKEIIDRLSGGETPREQFISLFQVGQASGRTSPEDILRFATLSGYELTDEDKKTFGITDKSQQPSADLD
jgi:hypothetical protein